MSSLPWPEALERYTQKVPHEVLRVEVEQADGELDLILIFRGFSSSLMRSTPADLSQPLIQSGARFLSLDRLQGPFDPADPKLIQGNLDRAATHELLVGAGLEPTGLLRDPWETESLP